MEEDKLRQFWLSWPDSIIHLTNENNFNELMQPTLALRPYKFISMNVDDSTHNSLRKIVIIALDKENKPRKLRIANLWKINGVWKISYKKMEEFERDLNVMKNK